MRNEHGPKFIECESKFMNSVRFSEDLITAYLSLSRSVFFVYTAFVWRIGSSCNFVKYPFNTESASSLISHAQSV